MDEGPGWLGRAQWMPLVLPPADSPTKTAMVLIALYSVFTLGVGVVVFREASIGWAFLAVALLFVLGLLLALLFGRFQQRSGGTEPTPD